MTYEFILVHRQEPIAVVQINRPNQLNTLNSRVMQELTGALEELDGDSNIRCMIVTGNEHAFGTGRGHQRHGAGNARRDVGTELDWLLGPPQKSE